MLFRSFGVTNAASLGILANPTYTYLYLGLAAFFFVLAALKIDNNKELAA